jgi:glycosyltransferase involved in cell wall biosynthesis
MRDRVRAAFLVQRIGPYHHARLRAANEARPGAVDAIEFRRDETVYDWAPVGHQGEYERIPAGTPAELVRVLDERRPRAVVCVGYADREISGAMAWALRRDVPLVTCSDSTHDDEPRRSGKEALKRRVVAAFDAALVSGHRAHAYLDSLGVKGDRRFQPWDVVDNAHFERGADRSRAKETAVRTALNLPSRYFLCVARFVEKKNLVRLIEAYARYVGRAGRNTWSLVLSGAGPLEATLRNCVVRAGLEDRVHFPGFLQYQDLPAWYGLAGAFVLPSTSDQWGLVVNEAMASGLPVLVSSRCGCAPDLVHEGGNGFTFDPVDTAQLAGRLDTLAEMEPIRRAAMGLLSREIVKAYSPEAFAEGLHAAIDCACARVTARKSWLTRLAVNVLATRAGRGA